MFQKFNLLTISILLSSTLLLSCGGDSEPKPSSPSSQHNTQTDSAGSTNTKSDSTEAASTEPAKSPPLVQCPTSPDQPNRFALCAAASCWTIDGLAYCKCDVLNEESISISYEYQENGKTKNICDLLLDGTTNGFTVSTYATPRQIVTDYNQATEKLGPPMALYTCATQNDRIAYGAQCDGGICFDSTQGKNFPGLGHIEEDEIVCSCPPTLNPTLRFQVAGPWSCKPGDANGNNECCDQSYYNDICNVTSVSTTGTLLAVSAPAGSAAMLSKILDGEKPTLNACKFN